MMRCIFFVFFIFLLDSCSFIKDGYYSAEVTKSFKGTQAYELAKAVVRQNEAKIKRLCEENPAAMYVEDSQFHYTLLHFAVGLRKYKSAKALLDAGMSANVPSSVSGETPLFIAARYSAIDIAFLKLLVEYGANPAIGTQFVPKHLFVTGRTPLMELPTMYVPAQKTNMEKAKYLVEVGNADINQTDADGRTVSIEALFVQDVKMAYYFIVELKADITQPYYSPDYVVLEGEEKKMQYPVSLLRDFWIYPLDSTEYKIKQKIVEEFGRQGVDYWSTRPSEYALKKIRQRYPDSWKEYLNKY